MPRTLSARAREQMIVAARELLCDGGIDACTADEIARRSGVAKSTMYRHFSSVDELVIEALDALIGEIAAPDTGSLRGDLEAVVLGFRAVLEPADSRRMFASMLARAVTDPEFAPVFRRAQQVRHVPLRQAIQRGIVRGEVDPDIDIEQAMYFVQGPFVAKRFIEDEHLTDDDVQTFLDLVCRALAPPAR